VAAVKDCFLLLDLTQVAMVFNDQLNAEKHVSEALNALKSAA
jgi:hypothetical protein